MSTWQNATTATLKVRKAGSVTDYVTFPGVNSADTAGTPENFLDAANHLLNIAGTSATLTGMTRSITEGVVES